jgi:hypothetical protein
VSDQDVDRLDYELRRQSPYFQAGRVIGSAAGIAQGLFEFVIGTGGDIAGGGACATVVGCTVGAPTIAGSIALQVHGATTAVAGAKNLGKVLSEIVSVVFASSSASGAGNNPGNLGTGSTSGGSNQTIPWSSPTVRRTADLIEKHNATEITVGSKSQAEELFLRLFQGKGYRNTTGWSIKEVKKVFGDKGGTYHWDLTPTPGDIHNMPHLQIHHFKGKIIRINFPYP